MTSIEDKQASSTEGADMYQNTLISRNSSRGATLLFGAGVALAASALFGIAEPAVAQGTDADNAMDEIIVTTARRREESLMDVPLSISVIGGVDLERVGAVDIIEIAKQSPNVTLEVSRGTNTTLSAFIRGVGQQDPVAGFEAGVGLYVDDIYFNRPHAAVLDLYEVERIEVLRGPQGTLYGRNTIGGAIKYVTRRIEDDPMVRVRGSVGSYGQLDGLVTASTALTDTFRLGGTVASFNRDGYGDNLTLGTEQYDKSILGFRATAEWDATDSLFFRLSGDHTQDDSSPKFGHRLMPAAVSGNPILGDVFDSEGGLNVPEQDVEMSGVSFLAEYEASDSWTFKAIVADREDSSWSPIDFDSLPADDLDVPVNYENEQFSVELQALFTGDRLSGVLGYYFLDANAYNDFDVVLGPTGDLIGLPGLNANTVGDVDTDTWSVFADFSYDLNDFWSLSLGGRYTVDERSSQVLRRTFVCPATDPGCSGYSPTFGGNALVLATTSDFNGSEEWTDFSPRASVTWAPSDEHTVYFSYAEGFKGGSFDPRGQTSAAPDLDDDGVVSDEEIFEFMRFLPETVTSYELGWRTTALDGRLMSSLAVFFADYEDVQIPGSVGVDTDGDGIDDTFTGVTTNAGAADLPGFEFEGSFRANDNWSFRWALGWLDAEYTEFIDASGTDVSDQAVFQNTPEWTASGALTYERPLSLFGNGGQFFFIPSFAYRDDASQFEFPDPLLDQESFTVLDLSIVWEDDDGHWRAGLHGKNLTDEEYKVAGYPFATLGLEGNVTAFYGPPQTVTATVEYIF
jgi:iron complex outermembrane receptor protein